MIIEIQGLKKYYYNGMQKFAVIDINNLIFETNNFYALKGPSGAGKSTLIHLISALENYEEGKIKIDDFDYSKTSDNEKNKFRTQHIGLMFQKDYLIEELNALDNLKLFTELKNIKNCNDKIQCLLDKFNLSKYKKQYPNQLSGGERQRLSLIRSLLSDPDIIIADEPTSNLDSENSALVFNYLKILSEENKIVIIATHNDLVDKYCNKIINIMDGKINVQF